jgi:hypothetical protein
VCRHPESGCNSAMHVHVHARRPRPAGCLDLRTCSRTSVCSCGSRTLRCGGSTVPEAAACSSLLAHSRTAAAARPGTTIANSLDHHHCARDTLAAHAGATTFCFCAVLFCHCVDTCKHNARRNARFAERAAPSCCSIHNGRPARPSGLPI